MCVSAFALSACTSAVLIDPIFAGGGIITPEDYVGKTFPLRYIGVDESTLELKRGTGTVRFISETELAVSFDGISETVIEVDPNEFMGPTLLVDSEIYSPELSTATAVNATSTYGGFLGFETAMADVPTSSLFYYDSDDGATMIVTNGLETLFVDGGVYLDVDFASGDVTGELFTQIEDNFSASIVGGKISGNGITGGVQINDGGAFPTTTNDEASGVFFGNDASALAGTFEGTVATEAGPYDFVGGFIGDKTIPD